MNPISQPEQWKTAKEQPKAFAVFLASGWLPSLHFRPKTDPWLTDIFLWNAENSQKCSFRPPKVLVTGWQPASLGFPR
jgi:hypothetical protein